MDDKDLLGDCEGASNAGSTGQPRRTPPGVCTLARRLAKRKLHGMIMEAAVELIRLGQRVEQGVVCASQIRIGGRDGIAYDTGRFGGKTSENGAADETRWAVLL
jgi:hypothetical protein